MKLTRLQEKLCYLMACDSRMPVKKMAELLRCSPENVTYHITKLFEQDKIGEPTAIIDPRALGLQSYYLFLQVTSREEVRAYLENKKEVIYVADCSGKFDIQVIFHTYNSLEATHFIQELTNTLGETIVRHTMSENVDEVKWTHVLPNHHFDFKLKTNFASMPKQIHSLSQVELQLLYQLAKTPRASTIELSKHVPLSHETIRRKITAFKNSGVIKAFTTIFDAKKFQYFMYLLLVKTNIPKVYQLKEIANQIKHISYASVLIGEYSHAIYIHAKNPIEFDATVQKLKHHFPTITFDLLIFQNETGNQFPKVVLE